MRITFRFVLVAGALSCLPACQLPTGPGLKQPEVAGDWKGTFESSWGALPVTATLTNERYTTSLSGEFWIDGQRARATVSGLLETKDERAGTTFWGSLSISYMTESGDMCRSENSFPLTLGNASERAVDFFTEGFTRGNCPDPPARIHITLRR